MKKNISLIVTAFLLIIAGTLGAYQLQHTAEEIDQGVAIGLDIYNNAGVPDGDGAGNLSFFSVVSTISDPGSNSALPTELAVREAVNAASLPAGGTAGQILAKASDSNYDTAWIDPPAGGGGVQSVTGTLPVQVDNTDPVNPVVGFDTTVYTPNTHESDTSNPHQVTAAQVGNTTAQWNASQLQSVDVDSTAPVADQVLKFDGVKWVPGTDEVGSPGSGEANDGANLGTGAGIYANKSGVTLNFKSLTAAGLITITPGADEIEISAAGDGVGGQVDSLAGTAPISIDSTDPANPIVSVDTTAGFNANAIQGVGANCRPGY